MFNLKQSLKGLVVDGKEPDEIVYMSVTGWGLPVESLCDKEYCIANGYNDNTYYSIKACKDSSGKIKYDVSVKAGVKLYNVTKVGIQEGYNYTLENGKTHHTNYAWAIGEYTEENYKNYLIMAAQELVVKSEELKLKHFRNNIKTLK